MRNVDVRHWSRLAIALLLAAASCAMTFIPATSDGQARWMPLIVAAPIVLWCAWPIHRSAIASIATGRPHLDILASVGLIAAVAWTVHAAAIEQTTAHLVPVALGGALVVASDTLTRDFNTDPYEPSPRWLLPLLLLVPAVALIVWWGSDSAASAAVSVLLVSAPCALRTAAPLAHVTGVRRGASAGISLHDSIALRTAHEITTVILDKDRTVTTGALSVTTVDPVESEHLRNLRWFAGALAHCSEHRVAKAIAKLAARGHVTNLVTHGELGLTGSVDRHPVRLGCPGWVGVEPTEGLGIETAVEVDGRFLGRIRVGDTLRAHASERVRDVRALGLDVVLVSDLAEADTGHIAEKAGITTARSRMGDEERRDLVQKRQADGDVVAFVGEPGINDSALAAADLPITVTDINARGIGLAELDIGSVHDSIVLARATSATARSNRLGAMIGMLAPMPFAAVGLLPPMYAPMVAAFCMIGVALNASRASRIGPART